MKSNILIVDDKEENLFSMVQILKDEVLKLLPIEIFTAPSGNEALKIVLHHDFALIILDVHMPEMDGYELAQLLRGKEETKKVPIILLTAEYKTASAKFKGYETGAVDFLIKPLNPQIIVNKIKTFVDLDQQKKELEEKNKELERFHELFVDREFRIKELRDRVKELEGK
ncbi:MAG: response regulator [Spirochaetaceae bacterium]|nr:response regulator [Spirochaetaceae bacterium]